jgi:predicted ArsR family transcriptional regulator
VKNIRSADADPRSPTRGQVARLILELGPSTAAALGGRLGLTPAAIRRHLDNLIAEGLIETRIARTYGNRGRGRPAKVFVITDAGRSAFEHAYDDLAASALRFLAETAGPEAVAEFARRQLADLERRYAPAVAQGELASRVQALAEALSADGYAASAGPAPAIASRPDGHGVGAAGSPGEQLCQHHCPVEHVAAEFPQLCEAETEAFGRLLGTPVQRLATIAHGDGICTTHVTGQPLARSSQGLARSSQGLARSSQGLARPGHPLAKVGSGKAGPPAVVIQEGYSGTARKGRTATDITTGSGGLLI